MRAQVFLLTITTILIFFVLNLTSCVAMEKIDKDMRKKIEDQWQRDNEEYSRRVMWEEKYLNALCLGMSKSQFISIFTKTPSWTDTERPYITKHVGGRYILSGLESSYDYRVTFENGRLIKFEYHGHGGGGNPFGYNDATFLLREKNGSGTNKTTNKTVSK